MVLFIDNETQNDFCRQVEKYVEQWKSTYIDAVISVCESTDLPVESVGKILSKPIVEKIQQEGQDLNFLQKTTKLLF